jgi:hypothetical protein
MSQKLEITPPLTVGISKCRRGIFGFLFKIDGINGRMRPKNHKVVVWGGQNLSIGSLGDHPEKGW